MDNLSIAAASGLRSRMEALDLLAHNLANASTAGFKADRELYRQYVADQAEDGEWAANSSPVVEGRWTDFTQGPLQTTNRSLDFAISGRGFFVANSPNGPLYTRDGSFSINPDGELITREGYRVEVRTANGQQATLDPRRDFQVAADGSVEQGGQVLGSFRIVDFQPGAGNQKLEGNYFSFSGPQPMELAGAQVLQGRIEQSNTAAPEVAVRLVNVMRQFEMLNRAMTLGGEMNKRAVEEVAKPS
jgi:flagellar basal body rod protein FlgG